MNEKTKEKLFTLLYELEILFDYDKTKLGKEIGLMINKLQKELLTTKI